MLFFGKRSTSRRIYDVGVYSASTAGCHQDLRRRKQRIKIESPNKTIKVLAKEAKDKLLALYNLSWRNVLPPSLKEAIGIPTQNKGKNTSSKASFLPNTLYRCIVKDRITNKILQQHLDSKQGYLHEPVCFKE